MSSATIASYKTALVTGSSNGIGEAIVQHLAKLDYKLVVTGRDKTDINRVASACELVSPSKLRPLQVVANLESEEDTKRLFDASMAHFDSRLDLLVNNAGFGGVLPPDSTPANIYANFKRTLQVNLNSAVYLTLLAIEPLKSTARLTGKPTSVVNISSIGARKPFVDWAYCVSKAGLNGLANCMVGELAPDVRVNTVAPGPVETKIIERCGQSLDAWKAMAEQLAPLKRIGQANEIAEAVVFLSDPERAGYITGTELTIDGGLCWAQLSA